MTPQKIQPGDIVRIIQEDPDDIAYGVKLKVNDIGIIKCGVSGDKQFDVKFPFNIYDRSTETGNSIHRGWWVPAKCLELIDIPDTADRDQIINFIGI